jgi:hypothetical protein
MPQDEDLELLRAVAAREQQDEREERANDDIGERDGTGGLRRRE